LNGTPQRWFIAFWEARKTPMPAQSAAARPRTSASVLPCSEPWLSCGPITGNWPSAESTILCSRCGWRWRMKPSTVVSTSSSGKIAKKP
jgi:hypothetical protein